MQKYGFTFKTVTIEKIKICTHPPQSFPNYDYTCQNFIKYICVFRGGCVCVCSMHTAGKEVVLAGITWFSKSQGFDGVPSVEQQGSCRKA